MCMRLLVGTTAQRVCASCVAHTAGIAPGPLQNRRPGESAQEFAERVQHMIAGEVE